MSKINDGGPAFPSQTEWGDESLGYQVLEQGDWGMSMRDYFAAKAMHAFLSDFNLREAIAAVTKDRVSQMQRLAECAYEHADAMLAERQKARPA